MSRQSLDELRESLLFEVDGEWRTASELFDRIGLVSHERDWYRVALICERLAHEGVLELRNPASRGKRHFRLRAA